MPAALPLDTYDGQAWLGIVPFRVCGARPRFLPPVPGLSDFPELNVRTYVTVDGKPGVYFFSLDAGSWLAVLLARLFMHLPYFDARMTVCRADGWIGYHSARVGPQPCGARLAMRYKPRAPSFRAGPGSLVAWLTERYCMYPVDCAGRVYRGEIHHRPWLLQPAEAELAENTLTAPLGITLPPTPPLLHYAERQDMVAWALERVRP